MGRQGPKRSPLQREQDRVVIARMSLQGKTQQEIANFLELDRSMISLELKAIRIEWKSSSLRDFDEARGQKLAELEVVKAELWQAWQESNGQNESTLTEKIGNVAAAEAGGRPGVSQSRIKHQVRQQSDPGDVAYLSGVVNCIKEQSKLLGLYPEAGTGTGQSITLTGARVATLLPAATQRLKPIHTKDYKNKISLGQSSP